MSTHKMWRKSSHSAPESACVELSVASTQTEIRDSKNPTGPTLRGDVTALVAAVKDGQLSG